MGAFQSKLWSEPNSGSPGSPSESQPLSNNGKPIAPFRDPRSISDGVERTPIQIAACTKAKISVKTNEDAKENRPAVDQTPTGPSLAQKFKELMEDTAKMEITEKEESTPATRKPLPNDDKAEAKNDQLQNSSEASAESITTTSQGTVTQESDCRSPLVIENDDSAIGSSGPEDILSPCNNRCGKKTLFPMVFGYQEAKSPRSPLGEVNLNTKFMPSLRSGAKQLQASGDCGKESINKVQNLKIKVIPLDKEIIENLIEQENDNDENQSLVI